MTTNLASTRNLAPTTHLSGTFNVSNGSGSVSTTSSQVNILFPGNTITFGGGTATGSYVIASVSSTGITLTVNYAGTSASTATATNLYGMSNCNLWLRGDLGITTATGVSAWADQSGVGANFAQATGANQPTLVSNAANGWPGVHFDGVNFFMSATWSSAIVKTIIIAWLDGGTQVSLASAFSTGSNAPGVTCDTITWTGDGAGGGTASHTAAVNVKLTQSAYNITAFTYDQTGTTYGTKSFFNGIGITNWLSGSVTGQGTTLSAPGTTATLGERNDGVSTHRANCTILEIATYSVELTPGQIRSVSNYMAARYGIQMDSDIALSSGSRFPSTKQNTLPTSNPISAIAQLPGTFTITNGGSPLTGTYAVTSGTTLSGTFNVSNGSASVPTTSSQVAALVTGSVVQFASQTTLSGTFNVTNGNGSVTASTSQTGIVVVGSIIQFGAATTAVYIVSAINAGGTTITLTGNYEGTTTAAATASIYYSVSSVTGTTVTLSGNYTGTSNAATTGVNEPTFVATSTSQVGILGNGGSPLFSPAIFFSPQTTISTSPTNYTVSSSNVSSSYLTLGTAYTGSNSPAADGYVLSAVGTATQTVATGGGLVGFFLPGTFGVTTGLNTVSTTSDLTSILSANSVIMFNNNISSGSNTTSAAYQILSLTSTQLTLTSSYTGATDGYAVAFPTGLSLPIGGALGSVITVTSGSNIINTPASLVNYITGGDYIIFGGTASGIYQLSSVSATQLVLTTNYGGTTQTSGVTAVYAQAGMPLYNVNGSINKTIFTLGTFLYGSYGYPTMSGLIGWSIGSTGNWFPFNAAVFSNVATAPDGTNTASILQLGTAAPTQTRIGNTPTGLPATFDNKVYTYSVYAKAGRIEASNTFSRFFYYRWEPGSSGSQIIWDLSNGQVQTGQGDALNPSHLGSGQYYVGNGWWRLWVTFLWNSGGGIFQLGTGATYSTIQYSSDGTGYIYLWGAQLNQGFTPGVFAPTGGSLSGYFTVTNGSNSVSTTVSQVGAVGVGNTIQFGSQGGVSYTVSSVSSTTIVLTANYSGTTTSNTTGSNNFAQVINKQGLSTRNAMSNRVVSSRHNISLSGTFGVTNGSNSVSTTADQTAVVFPGNTVVFGSPKNSSYTVSSLTSTSITLTSNYGGISNTATGGIVLIK